MSISSNDALPTDFDQWIAAEFEKTGPFTAMAVLVEVAGSQVTPLCSTYFNVIGSDVDWGAITILFAGAGRAGMARRFFRVCFAGWRSAGQSECTHCNCVSSRSASMTTGWC